MAITAFILNEGSSRKQTLTDLNRKSIKLVCICCCNGCLKSDA